jgi:undecaprenyl-diphosphatase
MIVGGALMFTGLVLALCERIGSKTRGLSGVKMTDALAVGVAQAAALVPGISRSGMTISGGLLRGVTREACVRFSFLLAIPVILGASAMKVFDMMDMARAGGAPALAAGAAASLVASVFAIKVLIKLVRRTSLAVFSYYCVPAGAVVFITSAPVHITGWLQSAGFSSALATFAGYAAAIVVIAATVRVVFFSLLKHKPGAASE